LTSLEEQALTPMLGEEPVELGLKGYDQEFLRAIRGDEVYRRLFPLAVSGETDLYTLHNVTKAIASFKRNIFLGKIPL
jgi:cytochrome c peroxidase